MTEAAAVKAAQAGRRYRARGGAPESRAIS